MPLTLPRQVSLIEKARKMYLSEIEKELVRIRSMPQIYSLIEQINGLVAQISSLEKSIRTNADAPAEIATLKAALVEPKETLATLMESGFKSEGPVFDFFVQKIPIDSLSPLTANEKENAVFDLTEYEAKLIALQGYLTRLSFYDSPIEAASAMLELWSITGHAVHLYIKQPTTLPCTYIELMENIQTFQGNYSGTEQAHRVIRLVQIFPRIDFVGMRRAFLTAINNERILPGISSLKSETLQALSSDIQSLNVAMHPRDCFELLTHLFTYMNARDNTRDCDRILADHLFQNGRQDDSVLGFVEVALMEAARAILSGNLVRPEDRNTILLTELSIEGFRLTQLKADLLTHINRKHHQLVTLLATAPEQSNFMYQQEIDRLQRINRLVESLDITLGSRGVAKRRGMLMHYALYYCDPSISYSRVTSNHHIIFSQATPPLLEAGIYTADQVRKRFCYDKAKVEAALLQQRTTEAAQRPGDDTQENPPTHTSSSTSAAVPRGPNLFRQLRESRETHPVQPPRRVNLSGP